VSVELVVSTSINDTGTNYYLNKRGLPMRAVLV
jgi:hypothetical protein